MTALARPPRGRCGRRDGMAVSARAAARVRPWHSWLANQLGTVTMRVILLRGWRVLWLTRWLTGGGSDVPAEKTPACSVADRPHGDACPGGSASLAGPGGPGGQTAAIPS